jgi:hypothetical protein
LEIFVCSILRFDDHLTKKESRFSADVFSIFD